MSRESRNVLPRTRGGRAPTSPRMMQGVADTLRVARRTERHWARRLVTETACEPSDALEIAKAWSRHHSVGGVALVTAVQAFQEFGMAMAEAALWVLNGVDYADVAAMYRNQGLDPVEGGYVFARAWADDDFLETDGFLAYANAGVPLGLVVLILWAGATTRTDVEEWLRRWLANEPIEAQLRLLAALNGSPNPMPPLDAPARFPSSSLNSSG